MNYDQEELLDALNLAYRLKGQAVTERQQSDLLLSAIRSVLEANTLQEMYQKLFDVFSGLIHYENVFVLEQKAPGRMQCTSASNPDLVGSEWNVDAVLKRAILGEPCAVYAIDRQPAWQQYLLTGYGAMQSALYCPFSGPDMSAVLVLCHSLRGYYIQHHVQMAMRYKSFVEQTLLTVNAKLLALESQQLKHEKERVEEHLIQTEKMASLGLLAAGIAHEINNPVSFVSSNVKFMSDNFPVLLQMGQRFRELVSHLETNDLSCSNRLAKESATWFEAENVSALMQDYRETLADCGDGLFRVREILDQLRVFARSDTDMSAEVDVNECVLSTLRLVQNELKYHCELVQELGEIGPVLGNVGKVNQVIMNLLMNAGQAIDEKGIITLRSGKAAHPVLGHCCYFSVEDNGCGIAPASISKVFDPFYTSKKVNEGTGLGLSISYSSIENMGGTIEVISELNRFTRFTVFLPLMPQD